MSTATIKLRNIWEDWSHKLGGLGYWDAGYGYRYQRDCVAAIVELRDDMNDMNTLDLPFAASLFSSDQAKLEAWPEFL